LQYDVIDHKPVMFAVGVLGDDSHGPDLHVMETVDPSEQFAVTAAFVHVP
jgi:hypothetical protein